MDDLIKVRRIKGLNRVDIRVDYHQKEIILLECEIEYVSLTPSQRRRALIEIEYHMEQAKYYKSILEYATRMTSERPKYDEVEKTALKLMKYDIDRAAKIKG